MTDTLCKLIAIAMFAAAGSMFLGDSTAKAVEQSPTASAISSTRCLTSGFTRTH